MVEWNFDSEFHDTNNQAYIDAVDLLECISERGLATPKGISEARRRENVIRLQCRRLEGYGLLRKVGHEVYELTEQGEAFLEQDNLPDALGQENSPQNLANVRIIDFNGLTPDTITEFNVEEFFEDPDHDYGLVSNDRDLTHRRIRNVKNSRLNRVMKEFPLAEPVVEQCAHWVRAMVGIHFFPDANHRTAMATLSFLLDVNNIKYPEWPGGEIERAVLKSKIIRTLLVDVRFDNLWERDELFVHWQRYFQNLLYDVDCTIDRTYSIEDLKALLDTARDLKTAL